MTSSLKEYNVVVMGEGGVGKSSLTCQFVHFHFVELYDPTIEDSYRRQVAVDGKTALISILDTAGQEEFSAMRSQYMRNGKSFLLCYSITNKNSFNEVIKLREEIIQAKEFDEKPPIVLVGTKSDLGHLREVPFEYAQKKADEWGCTVIETSSKNRTNVDEAFFLAVRALRKLEEPPSEIKTKTTPKFNFKKYFCISCN